MKTPSEHPNRQRRQPSKRIAISCSATNPDQWLTLYKNGSVRVHVRNMDTGGTKAYRTLDYRPKLRSDREAIRRLIGHLNLVAAGHEGTECQVANVFHETIR